MEAIVLAGGLGTRLRPAVPDRPKSMAPVAGRPFLEFLLDYWIAQGVTRFVLSVGYRHELISSHFGQRYKSATLGYSVEEKSLGTGGGLFMAMQLIAKPGAVLVCNGDTYFEVGLREMTGLHARRNADLTIALFRHPASSRYTSVTLDSAARVVGFDRDKGAGAGLANGGVYLMQSSLLDGLGLRSATPYSLENELFGRLLETRRHIHGLVCDGRFIDIGIPEDYARASAVLGQRQP